MARHFKRWIGETKVVPVRLPVALYEKVTTIARRKDIAASMLIRRWIAEAVRYYDTELMREPHSVGDDDAS